MAKYHRQEMTLADATFCTAPTAPTAPSDADANRVQLKRVDKRIDANAVKVNKKKPVITLSNQASVNNRAILRPILSQTTVPTTTPIDPEPPTKQMITADHHIKKKTVQITAGPSKITGAVPQTMKSNQSIFKSAQSGSSVIKSLQSDRNQFNRQFGKMNKEPNAPVTGTHFPALNLYHFKGTGRSIKRELFVDKNRAAAVVLGDYDIKTTLEKQHKCERGRYVLPQESPAQVYLNQAEFEMGIGGLETAERLLNKVQFCFDSIN